jgi:cyclic pyranopterin phosphate synthase
MLDHASSPPVCLAPFNSAFFSMTGKVYFCLANRVLSLGQYPEDSVEDILLGKRIAEHRSLFTGGNWAKGCEKCEDFVSSGSESSAFLQFYSTFPPDKKHLPRYIDFELDNRCNLSCIMCRPFFSSAIPLSDGSKNDYQSPYDESFYTAFDSFAPQLQKAHFRGGEPFLIARYPEFWERLISINPEIRIGVTTNGTILPERVLKLIRKNNFDVNISLDSLKKESWEKIRMGGDFNDWQRNLNLLIDHKNHNRINLKACICLMRLNYEEIPHLIDFCNVHDISAYINIVETPYYLSLASFRDTELNHIIHNWRKIEFRGSGTIVKQNQAVFNAIINQLSTWEKDGQRNKGVQTYAIENIEDYKNGFISTIFGQLQEERQKADTLELIEQLILSLKNHEMPGYPIELAYAELIKIDPNQILRSLQEFNPKEITRKILDAYFMVVNTMKYGYIGNCCV